MTAPDQILPLLGLGCLHVGVLAARQQGDKHLCEPNLTCIAVDPPEGLAGKIHKQLLAGLVVDYPTDFCGTLPRIEVMDKLGVAIPAGVVGQIASP
ncbi:MAG: hypothetical protein U5K69_19095 [Balneolaceae bacterium]|nr:hypothetical protein [Balneolaceae bacterium]